jgi:hypothetical protein
MHALTLFIHHRNELPYKRGEVISLSKLLLISVPSPLLRVISTFKHPVAQLYWVLPILCMSPHQSVMHWCMGFWDIDSCYYSLCMLYTKNFPQASLFPYPLLYQSVPLLWGYGIDSRYTLVFASFHTKVVPRPICFLQSQLPTLHLVFLHPSITIFFSILHLPFYQTSMPEIPTRTTLR